MTPEKRRRPVTRATKCPSTPKSQQCSTLTRSSSENSSGELVIDVETDDDTQKHSTPDKDNELKDEKPTRVLRRKRRKMSVPDDTDALFDAKFEETIRKSAAKNNLTPICVKKLLKKLVMNDHVFAIVRLKEEEEERKKNSMAETSQKGDDGDDEEDDEDVHTLPKLTRLKAKQLNQTLFPLVPLNAPATDKEVAALIREDLNSDDDDEEYKPGEDDVPSDDDPNTTISDIDSQPRTPATSVTVTGAENEFDAQYTKDGLFKIPKPRNDSYCSQSEQEQENIALRTRSKLCLTTTDIETLESTFIPPDITTDMYEYDGDMDQAWKDFLEEFTKPLPKDLEDDDDNDPEYVAADKVPLDAEEMRSLKVSKKELNELVSELMEMSNIDEPYLEQALNETINESLSCAQIDSRADMLRTPLPEISELQPNAATIQSTYPAITEKLPAAILADQSETIGSQGVNCIGSSIDQNVSVLAPHFTSTPRMLTYPLDSTRDARADNTVTEYETNETHNSSLSSTSNMQSNERFFIKYSIPDETFPFADNPSEIIKPKGSEVKRYRFHTTEVPVKVELSDAALGFTDFQLQLLQQQLRMHVQLTAQHFLQTYAHPLFWETAKTCKDMLEEVEAVSMTKPNILPCNLPAALECCRSWEDELAVVNVSNKLFIKCLDEEITVGEQMLHKTNKHYQSELHWRIKEKMVNCKAFMYPALIPHKTFRLSNKECKQVRFTQGELQLIAFWFERASKEMKDDHNARWPNKIMKKPTNRDIINYTIKHFWPNYTWKQLDALVRNRKSIIYPNPLDFFLRNGYAPPFKHVLEHIDVNNVIPLAFYQKGILPASWDRFIASRKLTPIAKQKKESPAWEIKDEQQQPPQPSSYLPETSDATSLLCKIQILPPEESSTASEQVENTSINPINETKCESATSDAVEPSLGDLVTNSGEISLGVVLADEPTATNEMDNGVSRKNSFSSSVESVIVECTCICHSSIEEIHVQNVPEGVLSCDELTVSRHNGDKNAKQLACPEPTRSVLSSTHDKNVVKHSVNRLAASATLYTVLKRYLKELKEKCERDSFGASTLKPSHPVGKVYAHFLQLDVYTRFLGGLRTLCENLAAYCHRYRTLQQYNPQRLSGLLQLFHLQQVDGSLVVSARYISHRFDDYCSMEDKDARYAFNYYEKVEETLLASGRSDLLERFEAVLRAFNELEDSVTQLYYQVEELLGESFPELVDMFLTFLLPGQAAEVGRFFEHFILTNMNDFLEKLNIFFAKQPSQIKKVHACLNELSNEPNVTMDQVKQKVLPLLKGSTLLSEWFLQLFPSERPPESPLCDYENVTLKKPPHMESCEPGVVYEQVPYVEAVPESTENATPTNAIRYIQGRIYQGALPARLTFLANNCLTKSDGSQGASSILEQNLCDEATLKAHAIRLNPLVHCPKGITYADVAPLLTAGGNADGGMGSSRETALESVNTEDESKGASSPKKGPPKLPIKKRFNSPTSRKLTYSPNEDSSNSTSPGKESAVSKKTPSASVTVSADSKALSTSKKLKTIIETTPSSSQEEAQQGIVLTAPPTCLSAPSGDSSIPENATNGQKSINGPVTPNERNGTQEPESSGSRQATTSEGPSWTREEDEIILLKIIKGYTSVDTFVQLIEQQLPERSSQQIRSRVEFLNEMLRKVNQK